MTRLVDHCRLSGIRYTSRSLPLQGEYPYGEYTHSLADFGLPAVVPGLRNPIPSTLTLEDDTVTFMTPGLLLPSRFVSRVRFPPKGKMPTYLGSLCSDIHVALLPPTRFLDLLLGPGGRTTASRVQTRKVCIYASPRAVTANLRAPRRLEPWIPYVCLCSGCGMPKQQEG
jgi:hypothetical protein